MKQYEEGDIMTAYCVRCKRMVSVRNASVVKTSKGLRRLSAVCSECGTRVSKILGK